MRNRRNRFDHLLQLIDNVYEAALDGPRWCTLAPQIAETFGSTSTTVLTQRVGGPSQILSMTDNVRSRIDDYQAHYWQRDIWVERGVQLTGLSRVGSSRDLVSDREFQETEFYRDWCRYLDVFYMVGAIFPSGEGKLGVLGIHRPRSAGAYEEEDKYFVSRFMPHLQRALRIHDALGQSAVKQRLSLDTLDRCSTATLLVAADASIIHANQIAEALLTEGTALCQRNGRLMAIRQKEGAALSSLIREATRMGGAPSADGTMLLRRVNEQPLHILVAPFRMAWAGQPTAGAIVFVRDPSRSMSAIATLRALFNFTPTEARIAQALANGKSIGDIAAAHRATLQTVRKQLKSIFAKTETNRQAQCVAVILRSVATIARA